eukprot:41420_1
MAVILLLLVLSRCMSFLNGQALQHYISEDDLMKVHTKAIKLGSTQVATPSGGEVSVAVYANKGELPTEWCAKDPICKRRHQFAYIDYDLPAVAAIGELKAAVDEMHADKDELIHQLHEQLSTSKEQLRLLESNSAQDAASLRAEIELIKLETEAAQRKAELAQAETHSEARTIDQLRDDLRQLETNHASKKEEAEMLAVQLQRQETSSKQLQGRLQDELVTLRTELAKLETDVAARQQTIEELTKKIEKCPDEYLFVSKANVQTR